MAVYTILFINFALTNRNNMQSPLSEKPKDGLFTVNGVNYLLPFIMITTCFALWGFANDVTNPLVQSFSKIFQISRFESSFVQVAFYLGYFVMAFPAALFRLFHYDLWAVVFGDQLQSFCLLHGK